MSVPPTPKPVPVPPQRPVDYATRDTVDPTSTYQIVADKVGFVPSLRGSDNLISLIGLAVGAILGIGVGMFASGDLTTAIVIAIASGFGGVLLTGIYIGIRNLLRRV